MSRRLLHVLTLLSAVLCASSLTWVARSLLRVDVLEGGSIAQFAAISIDGQLVLMSSSVPEIDYFSEYAWLFRPAQDEIWNDVSGVRWLRIGWGTSSGHRIVILPLWLLPILAAFLPVRWWFRHRSRSGTRGFAVVEPPAEQT